MAVTNEDNAGIIKRIEALQAKVDKLEGEM